MWMNRDLCSHRYHQWGWIKTECNFKKTHLGTRNLLPEIYLMHRYQVLYMTIRTTMKYLNHLIQDLVLLFHSTMKKYGSLKNRNKDFTNISWTESKLNKLILRKWIKELKVQNKKKEGNWGNSSIKKIICCFCIFLNLIVNESIK